ncbi:chemotaxis response regulator protein-glutamate methylesterase [Paenibacillus turpanensis]|uniref:protein-glutamate methylesterase/protein-glutamine glutaminase n=1 Tax=Paenibacillus turpanensis TaxID=2689078 RepID=UPI00313355B1
MHKVLVVDDSAFMRKMVSDIVSDHPQFEVIGTARNGKEAIEKTKQLKPDILTMDIEMPEMNGLDALTIIMKEYPTPVVMLSSLTQEGAAATIRALELGAVDFIGKPSGSISLDIAKVKTLLHDKLLAAVKSNVRKHNSTGAGYQLTQPRAPIPLPATFKAAPPSSTGKADFTHLVAIGTSTGGPRALQHVLVPLPKKFPAPILIVQHMPPGFTASLAQRLNSLCEIGVKEAEHGDVLEAGMAYIAPGGSHMTMIREGGLYKVSLNKDEPRGGHRPSVDTMYDSLLSVTGLKLHLVIMTGMGSDGAKGMEALYKKGVQSTIAEAEQTCVVYGMPRSAVELKCVDFILPQNDIPAKLVELVSR